MEIQKIYDSFVYCQNEEEAKKLLLFLAAQGYLWPDGSSLKKNLWTESNKYYFPDSKTKEVTVWDIHAIAYIQNRYKDTSPVITFEQICGVKNKNCLSQR